MEGEPRYIASYERAHMYSREDDELVTLPGMIGFTGTLGALTNPLRSLVVLFF